MKEVLCLDCVGKKPGLVIKLEDANWVNCSRCHKAVLVHFSVENKDTEESKCEYCDRGIHYCAETHTHGLIRNRKPEEVPCSRKRDTAKAGVKEILKDREETHGPFCNVADTTMHLRVALKAYPTDLTPLYSQKRLALEMIMLKISRIINGAEDKDSWLDIAGYAQLIVDAIELEEQKDLH